MSLVVPQTGLDQILFILASNWDTLNTVHLYQNNLSPVYGTVLGDFLECTFSGYGAQAIGPWPGPLPVGDGVHEIMTAPTLTFTSGTGSSNNVYGYYCLDGSGNLIFAELFPGGPYDMGSASQSLAIQIGFTARSEF